MISASPRIMSLNSARAQRTGWNIPPTACLPKATPAPGREKLARCLEASSVGRSLSRAQAMLDEIAQFERE